MSEENENEDEDIKVPESPEKLSLPVVDQLLKAYIYLKKFSELDKFIEKFNISEASIVLSICILKNTSSYKNLLSNRMLFAIKLKQEVKERSNKFLETIRELE